MKSLFNRFLFIITSIFIALIVIEGMLRVAGFVYLSLQRMRTEDKEKGTYRILALGESTTAGVDSTWPIELEKILNEQGKGPPPLRSGEASKKFSVINEGIAGVDTAYILAHLEETIERYRPDMVITMMGINDHTLNVRYDDRWHRRLLVEFFRLRLVKVSRLAWTMMRNPRYFAPLVRDGGAVTKQLEDTRSAELLKTIFFTPGITGEDVARLYQQEGLAVGPSAMPYQEITKLHYKKLFAILKHNGISYAAMQYPTRPITDIQKFFEGVAGSESILFVDNETNFAHALETMGFDELFKDNFAESFGHTTQAGSRLIAQSAAHVILPWVTFSPQERVLMKEIERESDDRRQEQRMEKVTRLVGPQKAIELLNLSTFPKAGRSHLLAHKIGEGAYELYKEDALPYCTEDIRSGCSHGLLTRAIGEIGFAGVQRMVDRCLQWSPFTYTMCLHAAGHAFTAISAYDIFAALTNCDALMGPTDEERSRCYNGVFMENAHGVHGGLIPPMHPWLSTTDLHTPCNAVEEKYRVACYSNQAGWWYADVFDRNLEKTIDQCASVPSLYQFACYDNVARVISTQDNNDVAMVKADCGKLPSSWSEECLKSIAVSVYSQGDEMLPFVFCHAISSETVKASCYERLVSDFGLHAVSKEKHDELCMKIEPAYRTFCMDP